MPRSIRTRSSIEPRSKVVFALLAGTVLAGCGSNGAESGSSDGNASGDTAGFGRDRRANVGTNVRRRRRKRGRRRRDHVGEGQPRVRFGQVHLFNSLYTAAGDTYCIGVGVNANILADDNVFVGVKNPIDSSDTDAYTPDATGSVQSEVEAGAGPH